MNIHPKREEFMAERRNALRNFALWLGVSISYPILTYFVESIPFEWLLFVGFILLTYLGAKMVAEARDALEKITRQERC